MITKRDNGASTKRGPGRIHFDGIKKAPRPKAQAGAWPGQHTNKAANLHPLFASILSAHFPLPAGPYPTAKWPDGCTHLPEGEKP